MHFEFDRVMPSLDMRPGLVLKHCDFERREPWVKETPDYICCLPHKMGGSEVLARCPPLRRVREWHILQG